VEVSAGQCHDSTQFESVLEATPRHLGRPKKRPTKVAGDKGYSYPRVREWLKAYGVEPVIPMRDDQLAQCQGKPPKFDKRSYRQRCLIEQCIGWLKECRRIGTRFEKLAINFLAMLKLGMIQRYLKLAFSDRA
jgi:transposase